MIKKLIINFLILILLIIIAEFIAFLILFFKYKDALYNSFMSGDSLKSYFLTRPFNPETYDYHYRSPLFSEKKRDGIIIFGCSFGEGDGLNDEQNLSGKLFKLTNYNVYNRSDGGFGTQTMLYQLETEDVLKVTPNCKYIIYVFIEEHLKRNLMYRCWPFLHKVTIRYKLDKNGELKQERIPLLFIYSNIYKLYEGSLPLIYGKEYSKKLFYKIIEKSYIKSKKLYPNSKFIILNYFWSEVPFKNELEKMGIQVLTTYDLTPKHIFSREWQISEYDTHPNEKFWDLITPLLIEKAGIK